MLKDLNSSNGTFVNNERVSGHLLTHGDMIRIGRTILQFKDLS